MKPATRASKARRFPENTCPASRGAIELLFAAMDSGTGIHEIMRADEREKGRRVVVPGEVPWLPAEDWDPTIVVSIDDNRVRLVAILARNPGNGAFRRLIAGIRAAGLVPTVVEPTREMRKTLKRWGWRGRRIGSGFTTEEIWRPKRAAKKGAAET